MTGRVHDMVRERRSLFLTVQTLYDWFCKSYLYNIGGRHCVSPSIRLAFALTCIDL